MEFSVHKQRAPQKTQSCFPGMLCSGLKGGQSAAHSFALYLHYAHFPQRRERFCPPAFPANQILRRPHRKISEFFRIIHNRCPRFFSRLCIHHSFFTTKTTFHNCFPAFYLFRKHTYNMVFSMAIEYCRMWDLKRTE